MRKLRVLSVGAAVDAGIPVESADDLLGALARLADGGIDVVALSLDLPEGVDAVRVVRERAPEVPVVAVANEDLAESAMAAGAADVLPPEADPGLLRRAFRYAVTVERIGNELRRRALDDPPTGLYNARGFERFVEHHMALAARSRQPFVIVTVHLEGAGARDEGRRDRWVVQTAEVLRRAVRDSDVVARVGPGRFSALLTGDAGEAEALVLTRLVDAVAASNAQAGRVDAVSVAVGAATYDPERPLPLAELIADADSAARRAEVTG